MLRIARVIDDCQVNELEDNADGWPYPWVDFETDEFPAFNRALEEANRERLNSEEKEAKSA